MTVSSRSFILFFFLFAMPSCTPSPAIDRHKYIPARQDIMSETPEFVNNTFKVDKGPHYVTVTNNNHGVDSVMPKNEKEVEDHPTYYGVVFFFSSVVVASCLFGIACIYEYKRALLGYLKRVRTSLMNACLKCSCSAHHKSCPDDDYCSYYRSTDNLIDNNKHFIHFMRNLSGPEENKFAPHPNHCTVCCQIKRACKICSSVDLQNESLPTESVETTSSHSHPTVFFDKETENVNINLPKCAKYSQLLECECNGMVQSTDNVADYGLPATINAEQVTSGDWNNRKISCVGTIRKILVKGKKRKNPNPRHVTFPPLPALEIVHEI